MISLACDQKDEPAKEYVRENGLIWTHGFAGDLAMGIGLSYKVRAIPATFLIGPDGRILAKNFHGGELKEAIRVAIKDDKVVSQTPRDTDPPRFPVTRFDVPGERPYRDCPRSSSSTTPTRTSRKTVPIMISSGCCLRPIPVFARPFSESSTHAK